MVSLVRSVARGGGRLPRAAVASLALAIALVALGLPAFASTPGSAALPSGPVGPAAPPLHELITAPIIDTYIDQYDGVKDVDRSSDTRLRLSRADGGEAEILLQFDLAGIPETAVIQSVQLDMQVVYARPELSAANSPTVALYRAQKPWCADADWTRYCAAETWCQPGAMGVEGACAANRDRGPEHINAQISLENGSYKLKVYAAHFDTLAQWVKAWVSGRAPNQGLILQLTQPFVKDVQVIDFAGSGYLGFPEGSAPLLRVAYTLPAETADVGGIAWLDRNKNGIREADLGDVPLPGITVRLYDSGGALVVEKQTSDFGSIFASVEPGDYYLCYKAPARYVFSPLNAGSDDTIDSDVHGSTGCSDFFALRPGQQKFGIDAGMFFEGVMLKMYFPILPHGGQYWP